MILDWLFPVKEPAIPTAHNILNRKIVHETADADGGGFIVWGKVAHTTVHPLSGCVLIEFEDATTTIWNPNHDEAPIKGRTTERLEVEE